MENSLKEIEIGDVVRLKSGGPAMTVSSVKAEKQRVEVVWFPHEDSELCSGTFIRACLEQAEKPSGRF